MIGLSLSTRRVCFGSKGRRGLNKGCLNEEDFIFSKDSMEMSSIFRQEVQTGGGGGRSRSAAGFSSGAQRGGRFGTRGSHQRPRGVGGRGGGGRGSASGSVGTILFLLSLLSKVDKSIAFREGQHASSHLETHTHRSQATNVDFLNSNFPPLASGLGASLNIVPDQVTNALNNQASWAKVVGTNRNKSNGL